MIKTKKRVRVSLDGQADKKNSKKMTREIVPALRWWRSDKMQFFSKWI